MQGTVKVAEFFRSSICCFVCLCHTAAFCYSRSISLIPDSGTFVNEWFLLQKKTKKKQHCVILLHDTARWSVKRKKRKTGVNSDWRMDLLNLSRLAIEAGGWAEVGS